MSVLEEELMAGLDPVMRDFEEEGEVDRRLWEEEQGEGHYPIGRLERNWERSTMFRE